MAESPEKKQKAEETQEKDAEMVDAAAAAEEVKAPDPPKAPEPPKEHEEDAPKDSAAKIKEKVTSLTPDTTVNMLPSTVGNVLMSLTDGGFQNLLAGARANVGDGNSSASSSSKLTVDLTVDAECKIVRLPTPQQVLDDEMLARRLASGEIDTLPASLEDEALARSFQDMDQLRKEEQLRNDEAFAKALDMVEREGLSPERGEVLEVDPQAAPSNAQAPPPPSAPPPESNGGKANGGKANGSKKANKAVGAETQGDMEEGLSAEMLDEVNNLFAQWLRGEDVSVKQEITKKYKMHALHALLQDFPYASAQSVQGAFDQHNNYILARDALEAMDNKDNNKGKRPKKAPPPGGVPKLLTREMKLASNSKRPLRSRSKFMTAPYALAQRKKTHAEKIEQLRAIGGLGTCGCCYDNELPPEAEIRCTAPEGHGFCISCVKRYALEHFGAKLFTLDLRQTASASSSGDAGAAPVEVETAPPPIDLSLAHVKCMEMSSGCSGHFSDVDLQRALPAKEYVRYSRRAAALQAAKSGLKLTACPACDFMVEMSDPTASIVNCMDPDCGKSTCRWCQEGDHRPLRCDEVEKDAEVKMRTFLEEHMAESITRRCPNCRKPHDKIEGCNHMGCPCGTHSCYLCGEKINSSRPYDHYKDGSKGGGTNNNESYCTTYGTPAWAKKNEEQARVEAEKALEEYLEENPELKEIMQQRPDVVKRTLSHVMPSSSADGDKKRRKK